MNKGLNNIIEFIQSKKNTVFSDLLFYGLLILSCVVVALNFEGYDLDLWARLIAGMAVVQTGQVAKYDFMSYTPTHAWYDHEWGSGVIFYLTSLNFGAFGLLFLQILLIFLTMFFLIKTIQTRSDNKFNYKNILIYFIILNAFMVTYHSIVRCHSFTFLFFIIELYILELIRKNGNNKLLYILPPMFLIWGNMHGGVCSGLGLLSLYAVGEALNKKPFKWYILTALACFAVLFINPYGYKYVVFLIKASTMPRPEISEWWWIFHKKVYNLFIPFKFLALFYLCLECFKVKKYSFSISKTDKTKFIVMLATLIIAVLHIKMMPFFVIVASVYCYEDIYLLFKNNKAPKWLYPCFVICLSGYLLFTLVVKNYKNLFDFKNYPINEVEFIRANHINGKILTNFGIGSFVAYKLYPQNTIYIDGRYEEVYNNDLMSDLMSVYRMDENAYKLFKSNPPEIIIFENTYLMYKLLQSEKSGWHLVYEGDKYGVFVCDNKYRTNFVKPNLDLNNYYKSSILNTSITFKGENKIDINSVNKGDYTKMVDADILK